MGEMKGSINFHYSKGRIEILERIAKDRTVDDDDRELAEKYLEELRKKEKTVDDDNEER